jgi:hypothetical protein
VVSSVTRRATIFITSGWVMFGKERPFRPSRSDGVAGHPRRDG